MAPSGFEPSTSGSLVLHSTTVPWQLLVFTSDNFRYLTLVQRDWWWYCSDWTCQRFSFWPHCRFETRTSGYLVLHSTTAPWQLLVFTSDNFRHLTLVQRVGGGIVLIGPVRDFSFWPHCGFESGTSGYLVLHSTTVPRQLLVFTSDNFRYLTLVQRDWWWYCSDWTCQRFSFWPHSRFEPGTSGSLVLHSTTVPWQLLVFTSDNFRYLTLGAEGLVVVLF